MPKKQTVQKDWLDFINTHYLQQWTHVYYSKADDKARIEASIPGYSQLYDIQTFPYIIFAGQRQTDCCKKLSYLQINEVLEIKMRGQ
ncbi:MAG: hypothetical protein IPI68_08810 [Chitinophagaceae bacterium]|nr:hypothetical protein [Chitinophagaceae bacterium]